MVLNSFNQNQQIDASVKEVVELGIKSGSRATENGDYETAKEIFSNLLKTDPENSEINNQLGIIYGMQKDFDTAVRFLRTAINIDPNNSIYHKNLGLVLANQHRFSRAIREFKRALELNPDDHSLSYCIAQAYRENGDHQEYEKILTEILISDPKNIKANNDMGIISLVRKDYEAALAYFTAVTDVVGAPSESYNHLGTTYSLLGEVEKAQLAFMTGVNLDPKNFECLLNLCIAERDLGNLDTALLHAETAISLQSNESAYNILGTIQKEKGEFDAAYLSFEKALRNNEDFAPAIINRGFIHLRNGDWARGFSDFEKRFASVDFFNNSILSKFKLWDGTNISGKRLYLFSEQGFGDTLQFFRFVKPLVETGINVTVGVQPELIVLLTNIFEN